MARTKKKPKVRVTTNIELDVWKLAVKLKIAWKDALTKGIEELAKRKK